MNNKKLLTFLLVRRSIYFFLYALDRLFHRGNTLFILCYHSIDHDTWRYGVDLASFKKQLAYLETHYTFISVHDLEKQRTTPNDERPSVLLTFDDGYKDIVQLKNLFIDHKISPLLFVLSDREKANRHELATDQPFLSTKEIIRLIDAGWDIGSHSKTHADLTTLSVTDMTDEIIQSKISLEKELHIPINYFAYPRGKYNKDILRIARSAGYAMCFTMDDGALSKSTDTRLIPRIGVDRTHVNKEFETLFSPSVVQFRKIVKLSFLGKYL